MAHSVLCVDLAGKIQALRLPRGKDYPASDENSLMSFCFLFVIIHLSYVYECDR